MSRYRDFTPWQKIINAASEARPLRLTASEIARLAQDQAIQQKSMNDDEEDAIPCSECGKPVGLHKSAAVCPKTQEAA